MFAVNRPCAQICGESHHSYWTDRSLHTGKDTDSPQTFDELWSVYQETLQHTHEMRECTDKMRAGEQSVSPSVHWWATAMRCVHVELCFFVAHDPNTKCSRL